jgi:hypothetical protein
VSGMVLHSVRLGTDQYQAWYCPVSGLVLPSVRLGTARSTARHLISTKCPIKLQVLFLKVSLF